VGFLPEANIVTSDAAGPVNDQLGLNSVLSFAQEKVSLLEEAEDE
jgi:hypothetical protein